MWIQLIVPNQFTVAGTKIAYKKGDFVFINNTGMALKLIANNQARPLDLENTIDSEDVGIVSRYGLELPYKVPFTQQSDEISPIYPRTLVINSNKSLNLLPKIIRNVGKLATVYKLLETYEVILILADFKQRALHIAKSEHERTLAIVGDLRVPYYVNDVFAVRGNKIGKKFCEVFNQEMKHGSGLAMLRTLYQVKPIAYYLPTHWVKGK